MIMGLYAIKDNKIGFMQPWVSHNNATAMRTFTNGANEIEPNAINTDIDDKELWLLGQYDDQSGIINTEVTFLIKANEVKHEQ